MDDKNVEKTSVAHDIFTQAKNDILVPRTKEVVNGTAVDLIYMIGDYFANLVGKFIFGPDAVQGPRGGGRTGYSNISRSPVRTATPSIGTRSSSDLQYVFVETEDKARRIQNEMIESIRKYGKVRVADLYEKSEKVKPIFTDYSYGWTNEADIHYMRNRDGYYFNMPNPTKIN